MSSMNLELRFDIAEIEPSTLKDAEAVVIAFLCGLAARSPASGESRTQVELIALNPGDREKSADGRWIVRLHFSYDYRQNAQALEKALHDFQVQWGESIWLDYPMSLD